MQIINRSCKIKHSKIINQTLFCCRNRVSCTDSLSGALDNDPSVAMLGSLQTVMPYTDKHHRHVHFIQLRGKVITGGSRLAGGERGRGTGAYQVSQYRSTELLN